MNAVQSAAILHRRLLREGVRSPVPAFVLPTALPLFAMLLTSQVYDRLADLPGFPAHSYAEYLAPAALLMVPMMSAGYAATGIILDAQTGFQDRLRLLLPSSRGLLLSRSMFDLTRTVPAAVAVLAVAVAVGAHLSEGVGGAVGAVALVSLWGLAYGGCFMVAGLVTRSAQLPLALGPLFMPLMFLSTAFAPRLLLPHWLRVVVDWNPFTFVVEAVRALLRGPLDGTVLVKGLLTASVVLVLAQLATVRAFRSLTEES